MKIVASPFCISGLKWSLRCKSASVLGINTSRELRRLSLFYGALLFGFSRLILAFGINAVVGAPQKAKPASQHHLPY